MQNPALSTLSDRHLTKPMMMALVSMRIVVEMMVVVCGDSGCGDGFYVDESKPDKSNPVTRVSDMIGGRVDLINKLLLPPPSLHYVYDCGSRNGQE